MRTPLNLTFNVCCLSTFVLGAKWRPQTWRSVAIRGLLESRVPRTISWFIISVRGRTGAGESMMWGQKSDLITVCCSLIRSVIEYASAVFANLPKYLSDALEGIQKRALRIILPNLHYDEALILSGLPSLEDRRAAACESFMRNLKPSNPVFGLAMSGRVTTVHSYSLRSCRNYNNKMCKTKRLSEFVSVKYLDFLS